MDFTLPTEALEAAATPAAPAAPTPALPGVPAPFTLPAEGGFTLPGEAAQAGVQDAANDDNFDAADHYLKHGETPEALDFAAKVAEYRAHHPKGKVDQTVGFLKGAWKEVAATGEDLAHAFTGKLGTEPKSGLGSFAQGVTHAATTAIQSLADHPKSVQVYDWSSETQPAWIKRMGERIEKHDAAIKADDEARAEFLQYGGKVQDYQSSIKPQDVVDAEDRADYDRVVGRQFEVTGMLRGGALKGGQTALKAGRMVKGLFNGGDEALSTDDWKERIATDAELHKTAASIRQGKGDNTGPGGIFAPVPEVDDATRERLLKEGIFTEKGIESGSVVADPGNILLMEGLRLPIVSKATGAALKLTGKAAEFTGGIADKVLGHGAGKALATGGGVLAGYEVTKHAVAGDVRPLGVALALLTARVALKRGGAVMGEAGSELMNPEAFNARAATAAAKAGEAEAAGAGPAALGEGSPLGQAASNFVNGADNAAAASRVVRRTIQGAGIGVTGSLPVAALSDNPEEAGRAVAGGVAFGSVLGPLGAATENLSLNRAMEINKAATRLLADKGAATTFEDPALQRAHQEGIKDLSYTTRTYFDALKGLLSGFKSRAGNPMNIAVLNAPDYAAQLAKRAPGADPDAAAKSRAFYDSASGTILVNKGVGKDGLRVDSAGHETGHFITDEVMGQMGRAYGDALRNAVEGGLFDGQKPTPEFQRFIDDYNSKTPGQQIPSGRSVNPGDILRHRAVSEYLAETTRNILGDPTPGRFILPKDVSDRMADKMVQMYGDAAGAKQDIFSRTDLPTIHAALTDVIFDLGRGLKPQQRRAGSPRRPTGEAVAPQDGSAPAPESGAAPREPGAPETPQNPAMPGNPAEPYADIGLTTDQVDAARDFHIDFPGMEPEAQRSNKKKGLPAKSKDARAAELGQEWDDAFDKYAEFLRTNGLKAPRDPQSFHQAVIDFYLKSDAGANPGIQRPGAPPPPTDSYGPQEPASSIESKTGILEQPEPGHEPENHGGGLLAPQPLTEEAIRQRITDAENKAVQSPEFAKKRNEKTRAAMQKEARVRAALEAAHEAAVDHPDALRKLTDEDGVTTYKGRLDPETIPAHKILLDEMGITPDGQAAISLLDDQVGKTVYLDYKSAPKTEEADVSGAQRAEEQAASTPDQRRAGGPSVEQKGKAFHVLGFKVFPKKGSVTLFGFSPDKWAANVGKLVEHLKAEGQPTGYNGVNDALLAKDMEAVVDNHKHGWKGDGSAPVEGAEATEGYTPQVIPPERFNVLNASLNIDVSTKRGSDSAATEAGALAAQERAIDNGVDVDAETGDVNPLRAFINKSGQFISTNAAGKVREGTADHLEKVYENIAPDLVTGLSDAPGGRQIVRPVGYKGDPGFPVRKGIPRGDFTASGFMPNEGQAKGALESEPNDSLSGFMPHDDPAWTRENADEILTRVKDGKLVGSVATKGRSNNDLDIRVESYDQATVEASLKELNFEYHGSQVISPEEAKKAKKQFPDEWSRVHIFKNPNGKRVDVWTSAQKEAEVFNRPSQKDVERAYDEYQRARQKWSEDGSKKNKEEFEAARDRHKEISQRAQEFGTREGAFMLDEEGALSGNEDKGVLRLQSPDFDGDPTFYHGTTADKPIKRFKAGDGELGRGVYVTTEPDLAGFWARGENGSIYPVKVDGKIYEQFGFDRKKAETLAQEIKDNPQGKVGERWKDEDVKTIADAIEEHRNRMADWVQAAGYVGMSRINSQIPGQAVIFKGRSLKSAITGERFMPHEGKPPSIEKGDTENGGKWISAKVKGGSLDAEISPDGKKLNIGEVGVDRALQKMGIGRSLVEGIEAEAARSGVQEITGDATTESVPFWKKMGFEIGGESKTLGEGYVEISKPVDAQGKGVPKEPNEQFNPRDFFMPGEAEKKVRAASIRLKDGTVIDAPSHSLAYDKANASGLSLAGVEEGFTLKDGTFIHRDEAYRRFGGSTTEDLKTKPKRKDSLSDEELLDSLGALRDAAPAKATEAGVLSSSIESKREFPRVTGDTVSGLVVRKEIPNQASIRASFDNPKILPGIREIPVADLREGPLDNSARVTKLAAQIKESGEINPLIVGLDASGQPYVLEGSHRIEALAANGTATAPALVVMEQVKHGVSRVPYNAENPYMVHRMGTDEGISYHPTPGEAWAAAEKLDGGAFMPDPAEDAGAVDPKDKKAAKQAWLEKGTDSPWFKRWFGDSKVVDDSGKPLAVYSGHSNAELYGDTYDPKKGTAGAYYATEDPSIASNYANGKIGIRENYEHGSQYRIAAKNGKFSKKLWQIELTPEQVEQAREFLNDEETGVGHDLEDYWKKNAPYGAEYRRRLARGMKDLQSIHDQLEEWGYTLRQGERDEARTPEGERKPEFLAQGSSVFEDLMTHLGIKWNAFDFAQPGVQKVYLSISHPLDAGAPFPPDLLAALKQAAKRERTKDFQADLTWTKDYPLKQWVEDIEKGNEYWTTHIPKKALTILQRFGYDGIKELGLKGEADRAKRQVNWLAFAPGQVKSATGNRGTFDAAEPNMTFMPREQGSGGGALADGAPPVRARAGRGALEPDEEDDTISGLARK